MKCTACSADLPIGSKFCPKCGAKLADKPQTSDTALDRFKEKITARQDKESDNENRIWHGGFSPKAMFNYWFGASLVSLGLGVACVVVPNPITWIVAVVGIIALWGSLLLWLLYQRLSIEYELTNQRFFHRSGLFRRVINRIEVIDIDDVQYEQSFLERFVGVGTIRLLSSDLSDPKLTLPGIDNVIEVANMIDKCRREERRKRGLHIETV